MANITDPNVAAMLSSIPGGLPSSVDLAPSIIFLIVYIALTPVLIWRWASRASRTLVLIRPTIFLLVRLGSLVLRAVMSKTHYGLGELIAELVMVSIGFLFLISPTVEMWKRHVYSEVPKAMAPTWLRHWVRIADLVLLAAIITAVVGSSQMSSGANANMDSIRTMRRVSAVLSLVVVVITLLGAVYTHLHFSLRARPTLIIVAISLVCLVIAAYRLAQVVDTTSAAVRSRAMFWVLQITMEVVALGIILAININDEFPAGQPSSPYDTPANEPLQAQYPLYEVRSEQQYKPVQV